LDGNDILRRSELITYKVVDGQAILLNLENGTYFSLNAVGTDFWDRLDGQQTIAQHATVIAEDYHTDLVQVSADLLELAEELYEIRLIETVDRSK
jgi:hypothetical protein